MTWHIALFASLAMVIQDILAAPLAQAQARNRAHLAGALDTAAWLVGILTTSWSVSALQGQNTARKIAVLVAVSVANYVGMYTGTLIGKRWIKTEDS